MENQVQIKRIFDVAEDYRPLGKPILTGEFDDFTDGGVRGGELVTISGQSGHGKTSYALWLTKKIVDSGVPCLWFTYEMNPWYLKEKFEKLGAKEDFNTFVPLKHSENTAKWIKERILEAKEKYACKIVFIDHLHYLLPPEQEMNISLMIGGIVRDLKQLAVETDTIVYLIAHMRKLQFGEKTNIDAVRDSALIINESDYVYLIERVKTEKGRKSEEKIEEYLNYSKVSLAKNRRTGDIKNLYFRVNENKAFEAVDFETTVKPLLK